MLCACGKAECRGEWAVDTASKLLVVDGCRGSFSIYLDANAAIVMIRKMRELLRELENDK